jgi:hypothetical protein
VEVPANPAQASEMSPIAEIPNEPAGAFRIDVDSAERDTARVVGELKSLGLIKS